MTTNKNGKYDYELEVGFDYKIVFSASGHIEQYLTIAAAKVKESERFIQGYEGETVMWELTDPTINVSNFKNPYTKIIPFKNGKADAFTDEEPYFTNFIKSVKVDLEKLVATRKSALQMKNTKGEGTRRKNAIADRRECPARAIERGPEKGIAGGGSTRENVGRKND